MAHCGYLEAVQVEQWRQDEVQVQLRYGHRVIEPDETTKSNHSNMWM